MNKFTNERHYIEISSHINKNIIDEIKRTDLTRIKWVHFSPMEPIEPIEPNEKDLNVLNDFFSEFPHIYLRWIDSNWLKFLPNLQKFMIGFNPKTIEKLKNHKVIGLHIGGLSKKDDLTIINQFNETLEELHIEGDVKNSDKIIKQFRKLKKLGLSSVKLESFDFLDGIKLEYLYNYGSRVKDFDYLGKIITLKSLHLKTNTTLDNLSFISNLVNLEDIDISYAPKITKFPNVDKLIKLKNVILYKNNGLDDIEELIKFRKRKKERYGSN